MANASNVVISRGATFLKNGAAKLITVQKHGGQGADRKLVAEFEALSPAGNEPAIRLKNAERMFGSERLMNIIDNQLPIMQRSAWLALRTKHSVAKCKEIMKEWLPGEAVKGKQDAVTKVGKAIRAMSADERKAILEQLQAEIASSEKAA